MSPELTLTLTLVAVFVSIYSAYLNSKKNNTDSVNRKVDWEVRQENRIAQLELALLHMTPVNDRVTALETKIGLFWHLVEENMGDLLVKANPIALTEPEQAAANIYRLRKSASPTPVLKQLDEAIARELAKKYMSHDEVAAFTMIQSAIRAQLVDRHEYPYK